MNDMHEVWEHAQLKARSRWTEVDSPAGRIAALLPPALPSSVTPRMDPVPALGQHTEAILRELDFDAPTIARLRAAGAI
jgi:crotonobetainyl-CoA:carnitine CoA-transferase CaiB-like acyl-CoA transferase